MLKETFARTGPLFNIGTAVSDFDGKLSSLLPLSRVFLQIDSKPPLCLTGAEVGVLIEELQPGAIYIDGQELVSVNGQTFMRETLEEGSLDLSDFLDACRSTLVPKQP